MASSQGLSPKLNQPVSGQPAAGKQPGLGKGIKGVSRGRKVFTIIMVVISLLILGGGAAIYFLIIKKPKPKGVELDVNVWMLEYPSNKLSYEHNYKFKANDESKIYKDEKMIAEMTGEEYYAEIIYDVRNRSGVAYNYTFGFDDLKIDNCIVQYYIGVSNQKQNVPESNRISFRRRGDFVFTVVISLDELGYNAECSGFISVEISMV